MAHTAQGATAPTIFNFRSTAVRTLVLKGEVWFVASDVAKALGYPEAKDMTRMLDEDEAGRHIVPTVTTNQHGATSEQDNTVIIINESGLYHAVLKSRKPEARPFRKWVTSEVLPAIRRTGQYAATTQPGTAAQPAIAADPHDPAYRSAWMASAVFCASIQIDLFRHFMAGGEHAAFRPRYLLAIDGDKPSIQPIERDACVFPWREAPRILRDPATALKTSLLADIAAAAAQRIAERAAHEERKSSARKGAQA